MKQKATTVQITPPNIQTAVFNIEGITPLVQHRFSQKAKQGLIVDVEEGSKPNRGKKKHEPANTDDIYNAARYISSEGWDGFNVSAIRCAIIRACTLVNFKMILAKLSVWCLADGRDKYEPEFGLIRIYGKPRKLESVVRIPSTGATMVTFRPIYDEWKAKIRLSFDADQFSLQDVTNLLTRVGAQVGIGEGRNSSPDSAGMGWGSFRIINE